MKKIILVALLVILFGGIASVFITDRAEQSQADQAQARADAAVETSRLTDESHEAKAKLAGLKLGPIAEAKLRVCFGAGWPENSHPEQNGLSSKDVKACADVLGRLAKSSR